MADTKTLDPITDAGQRFAAHTAHHQMEVLHQDGLYRHVRFTRHEPQPDGTVRRTGMYWFDLLTWPGNLVIDGDMGTFHFARARDMFGFFRDARYGVNPSYWAEKIRAGSEAASRAAVKAYSEDKLRRYIAEHVADVDHEWPGLAARVQAAILADSEGLLGFEDEARAVVSAFSYTVDDPTEPNGRRTFRFDRFDREWEWDLHDYTYQYLWCCHAIQWGIAQYDTARAAAKEEVTPGA